MLVRKKSAFGDNHQLSLYVDTMYSVNYTCTANFRRTIAALPYIFYDISKSIHHTGMFQLSSESWHQDVSNEWCSIAVRSLLSPQRPKMYLGCFFLVRPLHILNIYKGIFFAFLYVWNIDYAFLEEERVQYRENMELYIVYYISQIVHQKAKKEICVSYCIINWR